MYAIHFPADFHFFIYSTPVSEKKLIFVSGNGTHVPYDTEVTFNLNNNH